MDNGRAIRWQEEPAVRHARERLDSAFDVRRVSDRSWNNLDAERRTCDLRVPHKVIVGGCLGSGDKRDARKARCDLLKHPQPLAGNACLVKHYAGEIAARPRQVWNKTGS